MEISKIEDEYYPNIKYKHLLILIFYTIQPNTRFALKRIYTMKLPVCRHFKVTGFLRDDIRRYSVSAP